MNRSFTDNNGRTRQLKRLAPTDFALEDQLLSVLHTVADTKLVQTKGVVLVNSCKFQVGLTIPDLVIISDKRNVRRGGRTVRRLTLFDCTVLAELLNCGPSRRQSISTKLYAQPTSLDRTIKRLLGLGLILERRDGALAGRRGLFPSSIQVISVEAKLRRWREALGQARKYLVFSNRAFIALPERLIASNTRIRPVCAAEGIGLLAVNPHGAKLLLRARKKKLITADWIWLLSRTVGFTDCKDSEMHRPHCQSACVTSKKRRKA